MLFLFHVSSLLMSPVSPMPSLLEVLPILRPIRVAFAAVAIGAGIPGALGHHVVQGAIAADRVQPPYGACLVSRLDDPLPKADSAVTFFVIWTIDLYFIVNII